MSRTAIKIGQSPSLRIGKEKHALSISMTERLHTPIATLFVGEDFLRPRVVVLLRGQTVEDVRGHKTHYVDDRLEGAAYEYTYDQPVDTPD